MLPTPHHHHQHHHHGRSGSGAPTPASSVSAIPALSTGSTPRRRQHGSGGTPQGAAAASSSNPASPERRPPSSSSTSMTGETAGGGAASSDAATADLADVESMSEADLIALIEEAELRSRVLMGENERRVLTESRLRDGLRETVEKADVEEDRLSNLMLRRADILKQQHASLLAHLAAEERQVKDLDGKFEQMSVENAQLESTLLAEESHIVERLRQQIELVDRQKSELAEKLHFELVDVAAHVERLQAPPAAPTTRTTASDVHHQQQQLPPLARTTAPVPMMHGLQSKYSDPSAGGASVSTSSAPVLPYQPGGPTRLAAQASLSSAGGDDGAASQNNQQQVSSAASRRSAGGGSGTVTPIGGRSAGTPVSHVLGAFYHNSPAAAMAAGLGGGGGGSFRSPSPSANSSVVLQTPVGPPQAGGFYSPFNSVFSAGGIPSATSALGGGSLPPPLSAAADASDAAPGGPASVSGGRNLAQDYSMSTLLQQEIDRVTALDADLAARSTAYRERIANLESRVDRAKLEWEKQRAQADKLRQELSRTKSLTRELVANHELLVEWETEREINANHSRGASIASTPRHVPTQPSPGVGGTSLSASRRAGNLPPLGTSPQATPRGTGLRSESVASQGDESSYSVADTPLQRSVVGAMVGGASLTATSLEPPTVLHGGTPMSSARRQYANGSACSEDRPGDI